MVVVLEACVLRLRVCVRVGVRPRWQHHRCLHRTAEQAVLLTADVCSRSAAGGPRADC
jgi:hypothetical protein